VTFFATHWAPSAPAMRQAHVPAMSGRLTFHSMRLGASVIA